jgi:hypothetical protein
MLCPKSTGAGMHVFWMRRNKYLHEVNKKVFRAARFIAVEKHQAALSNHHYLTFHIIF